LAFRVIAFGKLATRSPLGLVAEEYARRIQQYTVFELLELKPVKATTAQLALSKEAALLEPYLPATFMVLDAQGQQYTSLNLAKWLGQEAHHTFIIGSAWGLAPKIKARARSALALSSLTMPHELARVVLLEQLYRVLTIQAGHPYHH